MGTNLAPYRGGHTLELLRIIYTLANTILHAQLSAVIYSNRNGLERRQQEVQVQLEHALGRPILILQYCACSYRLLSASAHT